MTRKIGLAGCGRMGRPMVDSMLAAGHNVQGFDVRPIDGFSKHLTLDPVEFSRDLTILFTVVRDQQQTDEVLFDVQKLVATPTLTHIVICSTLSPRYVNDLRARIPAHITLIDAPMSGAAISAKEARLSFMLGGQTDEIAELQPLFDAMGAHFHHMGDFGAGMAAKVLNNLVAASSTAVTRLALDWGDALGIDQDQLLALMHTSSGQSWFGSNFADIEFSRDGFDPENTIGILKKDVQAAIAGAPDGSDMAIPEVLIYALENLKPR